MRLMEAVAIFATPGAVAQGVAYGLHEVGRKFANAWFGANRNLISRHYHRIGSAGAFRDLVADPERFREAHAGAAPKIAQSSRFWGRESSERDLFEKRSAKDLIEQARHDLIDTSLRSALVSMKKSKTDYLDLGAWQKNEAVHADVFGSSLNHVGKGRYFVIPRFARGWLGVSERDARHRSFPASLGSDVALEGDAQRVFGRGRRAQSSPGFSTWEPVRLREMRVRGLRSSRHENRDVAASGLLSASRILARAHAAGDLPEVWSSQG